VTDLMVFLDNTVLTNFALIGRPDLIFSIWPDIACTVTPVMEEYQTGVQTSNLPRKAWDGLLIHQLTDEESAMAASLPPKLGAGERACLAAAIMRQGVFASDDQQARCRFHWAPTAASGAAPLAQGSPHPRLRASAGRTDHGRMPQPTA